ncbi:MAG TPA: VOC family protein [Chloroflexota bacterium]|nr:VOC family protein [Chloroflexota bacterium]
MRAQRVLETCLYVEDLDAAETFYASVLGLERDAKVSGRHVFFRCGEGMLLLFDPRATSRQSGNFPTHGAFGPGHAAFAVTPAEISRWRDHLRGHGVPIEAEVSWPNGGQSLYFRDPAGNSLEFATPAIWGLPDDGVCS